jgi:gamma-glutamyltranspeptidase/glutathione hydrolase
VYPSAGNIGGGGFMMIYDNKANRVDSLDYREKAPLKAYETMFLNDNGAVDKNKARFSIFSSGIPGTVAGMVEAHKKHGKLPFKKLLEPAIKLAQGMPLSFAMAQSLNSRKKRLSKDNISRSIFTKKSGEGWKAGDWFTQKDLANTLTLIANTQGRDFYHGETAQKINDYFYANKGLITKKDLESYRAVWRQPVSANIKDYQVYSMPPPSSGGIHLIQLLKIINEFDIAGSFNTAYSTHLKAEAMKFAYADRSQFLGDPDFVDIPVDHLISSEYTTKLANHISADKVIDVDDIKPGKYLIKESPETTHYTIMDKDGNMVSNTYTLNFSFGSGITVPGTGMLLNNEMDDFSAKPGSANAYGLLGSKANAIKPGKRPLSSMTPVIILHDNKPWLATGSPGGSRIITIVFNFLVNRLFHDLNIAEATIAPRIHHQWHPDQLSVEKFYPLDSAEKLKALGHNVKYRSPWGSLHSIEYKNGLFMGFADPRRPGALAKGINSLDQNIISSSESTSSSEEFMSGSGSTSSSE